MTNFPRDKGLVARLADLENRLYALERRFSTTTSRKWTALPFSAGYSDNGGGQQVCQYRRIGDEVELRGLAKSNGTTAFIATLPVGFRPPAYIIDDRRVATGVSSSAPIRVDIDSSGLIQTSDGVVANGFWVTLQGIRFSVTP